MKKPDASSAFLAPDADGWCVRLSSGETQFAKTLEEAAATLPAGAAIHLALPCTITLLERLTLPSLEREELAGMVLLQLEKTLPYPIEEVTSDFYVINQSESDSTLISVAAHTPQVERLCAALRTAGRLPQRVTLFAAHVAASCPAEQTALCVWQEEDQLVVAICEHGKLSTAQTFPGADAETLLSELPAMLLRAELEGVPVDFASIRLETGCAALRPALTEFFQKPVELVSFKTGLPDPGGDLRPVAWQSEQKRLERSGRLKQRLQFAAFVYLLLVAGAFVYLAWMKTRVRKIDIDLATTRPQIEFVKAQQARWEALLPAIEPSRYPIEILRLVQTARPNSEVKFNVFDFMPSNFTIKGEATLDLAVDYGEKLKAEAALTDIFELETPNPTILKDNKAKFEILGKPKL